MVLVCIRGFRFVFRYLGSGVSERHAACTYSLLMLKRVQSMGVKSSPPPAAEGHGRCTV